MSSIRFLAPFAAALAAGTLLSSSAEAADDIVTGPPEGTALTPIPCYANSGALAGREQADLAEELGDRPGALLFIHELNRNTAPIIRGLDNLGREFSLFGLKTFAIRLLADRTAGEEEIARVNGALNLASPIVLSLDGLDGPGNYALNRKCTLSLILVDGGKVRMSTGYVDAGMADLPAVRKMIEEMLGKLPEDRAALERIAGENLPRDPDALRALAVRQAVELQEIYHERAVEFESGPRYPNQRRSAMNEPGRMQREDRPAEPRRPAPGSDRDNGPAAPKREGSPPEDPRLNSLLRSFIRQTNEDAATDEIFADILARGDQNADLGKQAVEMFKLMLSFPDRYGSPHAQGLARQYLGEGGARK